MKLPGWEGKHCAGAKAALIALMLILLPATAQAQAVEGAEKLIGQVLNPVICPSNPDVIAYGRLDRDAQELYLYHRQTGVVSRVEVRQDDADEAVEALFTDLFEDQNLDQFSRYDGQPAWRPRLDAKERQWFAFVSGGHAGFDIHLSYIDAQGRLASEPPIALPFDGLEQFPRWSPDGQQLVFVSGNESGSDLYLALDMGRVLRGGGRAFQPIRLTANPNLEAYPAWSPDGKYIAYQTLTTEDNRQNWGISVVHLDDLGAGSVLQPVRLTSDLSAHDEFKPSWAPDGQHVAFYVSQARVDEPGDNLQQDIGVLGVVKSSGTNRIVRGRPLIGFSPRLAINVIPNENRGPSWMPLDDALLLVHVKRDAGARFPIYATDFLRWQSRQPGYEQELSASFGTQYHRDPVLAALPTGVRVAFVSQEGGANKLQVFDRPGQPGVTRRLTIPVERSRGTALTRSLFVPGLGQLYKGQSTKGLALLAAEAASLGAAFFFLSQVDSGKLDDLEAAYLQSVPLDGACLGNGGQPCQNSAFLAWQDEYDSAESNQTFAIAAFSVAAGLWVFNLIDSAGGFPRTVDRPIRLAKAGAPRAWPHLAYRHGAPHYGLRLQVNF